jgi:hypothetical protein
MRKLTLFSTLVSLWIFGIRVSQDADGVPTPTVVNADWMRQQGELVGSASIPFFDRHCFQDVPGFTSIKPATWSPELLNASKTKSAGVDVAWHHWSSNHYQSNGQSAITSALSMSIDSRES